MILSTLYISVGGGKYIYFKGQNIRMGQKILQKHSYKPSDLIFREGEIGKHALFIESGLVETYHEHEDGSVTILGRIGQHSIVGEMAILGGDHIRAASVRAVAPTTVVVIEEHDLLNLFRPEDKVLRAVVEIIIARLNRVNKNYSSHNKDMNYVLYDLLPKLEHMMTANIPNTKSYLHTEVNPIITHLKDCIQKYQIDDLQIDTTTAPHPESLEEIKD